MTAAQLILLSAGACAMFVAALGCLLPVVPGPLIAYAALWLPLAFGLAAPPAHLAAGAAVAGGTWVAQRRRAA